MNEQVSFTLRGRNPDVLTCIANLSNDEVFTPPELAGRMLDMLASLRLIATLLIAACARSTRARTMHVENQNGRLSEVQIRVLTSEPSKSLPVSTLALGLSPIRRAQTTFSVAPVAVCQATEKPAPLREY